VQDMLQEALSFRPVDCGAGAIGTNRRLPEDTHNIRLHIPAGSNNIYLNVQKVTGSARVTFLDGLTGDIRRRHFANAFGYAVNLLQLPVGSWKGILFSIFSRRTAHLSTHLGRCSDFDFHSCFSVP
jgi:hypothetical protein